MAESTPLWPVFYWVDLNTSLGHHEPQELSCRHPECTFIRIQLHVIRTKGIEGFLEVIQMIILLNAFYQHVIYIDLNIPPNLMYKHLVHQPLIRGTRVLKSERHYFVAEETLAGDE